MKQSTRNSMISDFIVISVPLTLFLILLFLIFYQDLVRKKLLTTVLPVTVSDVSIVPYPLLISEESPFLSASAAIVMDHDSQNIIFSKNENLRFSMASTTKIMTALVATEYFKPNDILLVTRSKVEGSTVGLVPSEQIYFDDMLYALLLPSGNDAAYAIADNYPGGLPAFINRMNEKAEELYLHNTHFADPAGLNDDGNYTTARDLARLSSLAIKNPQLLRVVGTKNKIFSNAQGTKTYNVSNLNRLLIDSEVFGIKTGTTRGAGEVLATAKKENDKILIIVVMKSEDRFVDTQNLFDFIHGNILYVTPPTLR